jgi:hypothetical protein
MNVFFTKQGALSKSTCSALCDTLLLGSNLWLHNPVDKVRELGVAVTYVSPRNARWLACQDITQTVGKGGIIGIIILRQENICKGQEFYVCCAIKYAHFHSLALICGIQLVCTTAEW